MSFRRLYTGFLFPLIYVFLQILRPFLRGKVREMIDDKNASLFLIKQGTPADIAARRPFWIHAASGEIEYARPVLRELKKQFPDVPVIVTYSSPSAKKILKVLAEVDAWGTLPWDFAGPCEKFLDLWQPRVCLIARTDVWPVMATACHQRKIPSLLFAATFARNSSRLKGASARVTEWALNQLTEIHCVSVDDTQQLQRLEVQVPVRVVGDTRFDQVFYRLAHPKTVKTELKPAFNHHKVLVAGSTWNEDEKVLLPAFKDLHHEWRLLLAPHEIHESHLQHLERELQRLGLKSTRYSQALHWHLEDVLILDQVGLLAELYTWGDLAFVGGSFKKQVHSVMEPLAAGLPVLVGPSHHNNREALLYREKTFAGIHAVTSVQNSTHFADVVRKIASLPMNEFQEQLRFDLQTHLNASNKVIEWCSKNAAPVSK